MTDINHINGKLIQLKSDLLQKQFQYNNYSNEYSKKAMLEVINVYKDYKSLYKSASVVGINPIIAVKWYCEGMAENSFFRGFYLAINDMNNNFNVCDDVIPIHHSELIDDDYKISRYGDGWSYTTFVDGEKIFIISNELDTLKQKVKSQNLPLD